MEWFVMEGKLNPQMIPVMNVLVVVQEERAHAAEW